MKRSIWWSVALVLALLAGALPVAAQGKVAAQVVEEAGCLAYVQPLAGGAVQIWIYCEEDGYYPAGTALHLVALPADREPCDPWTLTDLSDFPGGLLTGEYWLRQNAIAPAAVLARTLNLPEAVGRLLRIATRSRVQRVARSQGEAEGDLGLTARQQTTTRSEQGSGAGLQEQTLTQTRQRSEAHAGSPQTPAQPQVQQQAQVEQQAQVQARAGQGGDQGRGQGR